MTVARARRGSDREVTLDVAGDLRRLGEDFEVALREQGWRVTFHADGQGGRADTGNLATFLLVGIFAGRVPVTLSFDFCPLDEQRYTLRIRRVSSGWWMGLLGASQAQKSFQSAVGAVRAIYRDTGALAR